MTLIFHPEAQAEFMDSIEFYESRSQGLGEDFAAEVYMPFRTFFHIPMPGLLSRVKSEGV